MSARAPSSSAEAAALARLLERLDADPAAAGERYEDLRHTLLRFFEWRHVAQADLAADETLDRLGRRLAEGEAVVDVRAYALGIARLVALEHHRRPEARHTALDEVSTRHLAAPAERGADSPQLTCFDGCFAALSDEHRQFMLSYYAASGRARIEARAGLASRLGLSANALRLRAQRVRDRLEECIRGCLGPHASLPLGGRHDPA
ncbi:MAG: RNA polymerase sigma factor [Vicinamibacterales bacterium]